MAGLAGQKIRITDTGYTTFTANESLRAADVPGGAAVAGTVPTASTA